MGGVFDDIASIGSDIFEGVKEVVYNVVSPITDAVKFVHNLIDAIITGNLSNIIDTLTGFATLVLDGIKILEPQLSPLISAINMAIPNVLKLLPSEISSGVADIKTYISEVTDYTRGIWNGPIGKSIKVFRTLSDAGMVVYYGEQGDYIAAIDEAFNKVAPSVNSQLNGALNNVLNWVDGVKSNVNSIASDIYDNIQLFDTGLGGVQNDLSMIGDAFGIKEFNKFADAIGSFRGDILNTVEQDIGVTQGYVDNLFNVVINPLSQFVMTYEDVLSNDYQSKVKFNALGRLFGVNILNNFAIPRMQLNFTHPKYAG